MQLKIGIDSNAVTYLATTMSGGYDPTSDATELREERVAMYRVFRYDPATMCVTPTVKKECDGMPDGPFKRLHNAIGSIVLLDGPWDFDADRLGERVKDLALFHGDVNDCHILAEAEQARFDTLLSLDSRFVSRLSSHTTGPALFTPSAYWKKLNLPVGAKPVRTPARGNPMAGQEWWRIGK